MTEQLTPEQEAQIKTARVTRARQKMERRAARGPGFSNYPVRRLIEIAEEEAAMKRAIAQSAESQVVEEDVDDE